MNEKSKLPLIREIYYDDNAGKIMIHDSNNNDYECNLYGDKIDNFFPDLTGFIGFKERKKMNQFESPIVNDKTKEIYHPQKCLFEGYFQFPNPISAPFFNEKFSNETKKNLINKLENLNRFKVKKNKHLLTLKSNSGLHYLTSSFRFVDDRTKVAFIQMIDNYIQEKVNENKYDLETVLNDKRIKGLKYLKKLMLMNKGDKKIFGRETSAPDKSHSKKFSKIEKSIKDFPKKKDYFFDKYMFEINDLVNKKPNSPLISAISTNNNYYNNTVSTNTYYNTQYFNSITTEKFIPSSAKIEDKEKEKDKENNLYYNTKTSFFSLAFTNPKTIGSSNNNDELSFISDEEDKKNGFLKTKTSSKNVLDRTSLQNNFKCEKMLLTGYKPPQAKEMAMKIRILPNRLKTEGDFYKESRKLLEKVNPKVLELEKLKDEIDRNTLEKRKKKKLLLSQKISIVDTKPFKTSSS